MSIDPKEQAFLDNLKAEFKKKGGLSKVEDKILDALKAEFDSKDVNGKEVITGADKVMEIVKQTVKEDKQEATQEVSETRKNIADLNKIINTTGANKVINLDRGLAKAKLVAQEGFLKARELHLDATQKFDQPATYNQISAMAKGQLPAKTELVAEAVETGGPAANTPATATPSAVAEKPNTMTAVEAAFLKDLKEGYALNGKKGKLSPIQQQLCDKLETAFNTPGQTGWLEIGVIARGVYDRNVDGVKNGTIKITDILDKGVYPAEGEAIINNNKEIKAAELLSPKQKEKELTKLEKKRADLEAKFEKKIGENYDWNAVVNVAKTSGFPENTVAPTPQQLAVIKAAGDDKVLNAKELQTLLKDPQFMNGAAKIGVHNDAAKGKDTLKVGNTDVALGDLGIELDAAVKDGDISAQKAAPAQPAKKNPRGRG